MKKITTLAFLFLSLIGHTQDSLRNDEVVKKNLLDDLGLRAKLESKLILLYFRSDICVNCLNMEEGTFKSQSLNTYIDANFVFEKLDALYNFDGIELAQKFNVQYLPTLVILNSTGKLQETLVGYQAADDLIKILRKNRRSNIIQSKSRL